MKSDDRTQGEPDSDSYYKETTNQIRAHTPHYTIRTTYASKEVKLGKNVRKLQEKENTLDILTVEKSFSTCTDNSLGCHNYAIVNCKFSHN